MEENAKSSMQTGELKKKKSNTPNPNERRMKPRSRALSNDLETFWCELSCYSIDTHINHASNKEHTSNEKETTGGNDIYEINASQSDEILCIQSIKKKNEEHNPGERIWKY